VVNWTPAATNQAGSVRLSHGSSIITAIQTRQEIVVWSDSAVYSLQYIGPPVVWSSQLLGDNISILSQNAVAQASGVIYWMGVDKFYSYDGRINTLNCDLRKFIYQDINLGQANKYLQVPTKASMRSGSSIVPPIALPLTATWSITTLSLTQQVAKVSGTTALWHEQHGLIPVYGITLSLPMC